MNVLISVRSIFGVFGYFFLRESLRKDVMTTIGNMISVVMAEIMNSIHASCIIAEKSTIFPKRVMFCFVY